MDTAKQTTAFQKLLEIARNGSVPLYTYDDDFHKGGRNWPVEWENELIYSHFRTQADKRYVLNKALERLVGVNFPSTVEQMNKEKGLVRLMLDAGADPNFHSDIYADRIFDKFSSQRKSYIALEIAKTEGFSGPKDTENTFNLLADSLRHYLVWGRPLSGDTKEENAVITQNCSDRKELVYLLFQEGLYPRNKELFQALVPIVLEKESDFFDKRKEQIIRRLQRAKTPLQIYNALMGQGKEKS